MKIYQLTQIGKQITTNPNSSQTMGLRIVYFLRRHGGQATGEQIQEFTGATSQDLKNIEKSPAVRVISG